MAVGFSIGRSFTFETTLLGARLRIAHAAGRYPSQHGAPAHVGDPDALGIRDLEEPEFDAPVEIEEGQIPVFWACGVTPQAVVMQAKPPLAITHSPGHVFITDRRHSEYEV